MARKQRSGAERFLAGAIALVIGLIVGTLAGFYLAFEGPAAQAGAEAGEAGAEPAPAAANELCIIQLRDGEGRIRADLLSAGLSDLDGGADLGVELDGQASLRVPCPAAKTKAALIARTEAAEFLFVDGVELDPAQPYLALDSGEATDANAYLARRQEAGIEAEAPTWITNPPPPPPAGDGEEEELAEDEPAPAGEAHPVAGELNVEVRDLDGETRTKGDIRDLGRANGYQFEDCVLAHGEGIARVRYSHYLAVTAEGKAVGRLVLQGMEQPELDACVDAMLARWDYGATEDGSFFKLKLVYVPKT